MWSLPARPRAPSGIPTGQALSHPLGHSTTGSSMSVTGFTPPPLTDAHLERHRRLRMHSLPDDTFGLGLFCLRVGNAAKGLCFTRRKPAVDSSEDDWQQNRFREMVIESGAYRFVSFRERCQAGRG